MAALTALLLQQLSQQKGAEAKALQQAGLFAGAWYLGGYVVELALKAAICGNLNITEYPETALQGNPFKTHRLSDLILLAGLQVELGSKLQPGSTFGRNWSTV